MDKNRVTGECDKGWKQASINKGMSEYWNQE